MPPKPSMVWKASMSEFVLNRIVVLMKSEVSCYTGFREWQSQARLRSHLK
jgi:hypothetical protein